MCDVLSKRAEQAGAVGTPCLWSENGRHFPATIPTGIGMVRDITHNMGKRINRQARVDF